MCLQGTAFVHVVVTTKRRRASIDVVVCIELSPDPTISRQHKKIGHAENTKKRFANAWEEFQFFLPQNP
jgi:hypothetical protein